MTLRGIAPAIILIGLFAGLASGQGVIPPPTVVCTAGTNYPIPVRGEGQTELVNDIILTCTGPTPLAAAAGSVPATASSLNAIPQMTVTVRLNTTVTSRVLAGVVTEALLLVDDPGADETTIVNNTIVTNYGSTLPISVCPTPTATAWQSAASPGCQEWVGNIGSNTNVPVLSTNGQTNTTPGYNAFPGVLTAGGVAFNGVPMLATAANATHTFRITNVRVNALNSGAIQALVLVTGVPAVINNPTLTLASGTPELSASLGNSSDGGALTPPVFAVSSGAGSPGAPSVVGYLRFGGNALRTFMTRVNPLVAGGSGQSATAVQDIPGAVYNSESGLTPYVGSTPQYFAGNTTYIPGLADSGTRVKAVFHNIPLGATIYAGTSSGGNTTTGLVGTLSVRMISSPTAPDGASPVAPTITIGGAGFVPLVPSNGSATATWEVITYAFSPYSGVQENFDIPVAVYAAPGVASPGAVTVNMSFAPTYSDIQGQQFIPSFADPSTPMTVFSIGGTPATPVPSSLILVLCGLGALLLFAAARKLAAR